jgi:hypothetical protein
MRFPEFNDVLLCSRRMIQESSWFVPRDLWFKSGAWWSYTYIPSVLSAFSQIGDFFVAKKIHDYVR